MFSIFEEAWFRNERERGPMISLRSIQGTIVSNYWKLSPNRVPSSYTASKSIKRNVAQWMHEFVKVQMSGRRCHFICLVFF